MFVRLLSFVGLGLVAAFSILALFEEATYSRALASVAFPEDNPYLLSNAEETLKDHSIDSSTRLCRAWRAMFAANRVSPTDPYIARRLFSLRARLSKIPESECKEELLDYSPTSIEAQAALTFRLAPNNLMQNLSIGRTLLGSENPKSGLEMLRFYETHSRNIPQNYRQSMYKLLAGKPELLQLVVPDSYPQLLNWISLISEQSPAMSQYLAPLLAEKISGALQRLMQNSLIDNESRESTLLALDALAHRLESPKAVAEIDQYLAELSGLKSGMKIQPNHSFYYARSGFSLIPAPRAFLRRDLFPERGVAWGWRRHSSREPVVLGAPGSSVVLYNPEGKTAAMIVVSVDLTIPKNEHTEPVFFNGTSQEFLKEVTPANRFEASHLEKQRIGYVFDPPLSGFIKLHYKRDADAIRKNKGELFELLQAYG